MGWKASRPVTRWLVGVGVAVSLIALSVGLFMFIGTGIGKTGPIAETGLSSNTEQAVPDVPQPEARVVAVRATDQGFEPSSIQVVAGEPVIILLQNMGTDEHHFHIQSLNPNDLYWLPHTPKDGEQVDIHTLHHEGKLPYHICNSKFGICPTGLDVHLHANAGDYDMVGFTPTQAGTFKFNCPLPGHEERGMVGALTVGSHR